MQNSQCTVVSSLSTQSGSLNSLTLTIFVIFKSGFTGVKNIYSGFTTNAGTRSTFSAVGTFTAAGSPPPLSAGTVTPSIGSGQTQGFTFSYADPIGYPDISGSQILFNATQSPVNGCYILFGRGTNLIALGSDDGNTFTPAILGSQTTLQNSQCIVFAGNSFKSLLRRHHQGRNALQFCSAWDVDRPQRGPRSLGEFCKPGFPGLAESSSDVHLRGP